jgi:dienelactone hydrolase
MGGRCKGTHTTTRPAGARGRNVHQCSMRRRSSPSLQSWVREIEKILSICCIAILAFAHHGHAESLQFQNKRYDYSVYAPKTTGNLPGVLLLHGAGGSGRDTLDAWKAFAKRRGIVLVAPDLPRELAFESIAPPFFRAVMDEVGRSNALVKQRLYVFGYSMGGCLAHDAAMFDSDYFAAVAVYGNFISPDYVSILKEAKRKMPIAIYAGEEDEMIPVKSVRSTRDLLKSKGFPVNYWELPKQGHNYGSVAAKVNADAWEFFEQARLP